MLLAQTGSRAGGGRDENLGVMQRDRNLSGMNRDRACSRGVWDGLLRSTGRAEVGPARQETQRKPNEEIMNAVKEA